MRAHADLLQGPACLQVDQAAVVRAQWGGQRANVCIVRAARDVACEHACRERAQQGDEEDGGVAGGCGEDVGEEVDHRDHRLTNSIKPSAMPITTPTTRPWNQPSRHAYCAAAVTSGSGRTLSDLRGANPMSPVTPAPRCARRAKPATR